jgi:2-phospho-L-lactate/phosphoenolpyruvate guanylyltransferase
VIVVVPFRADGKSRLPSPLRRDLALAMLGDVVEAALPLGEVRLVTGDVDAADAARALGAAVVSDPGGGQGAAVEAALAGVDAPCLVVNADLPLATTAALRRLASAAPGLVAAADGTTNALALLDPRAFVSRYGEGSAARFAADGFRVVSIPELERDVDFLDDVARLVGAGSRTSLVLSRHKLVAASLR